MYAFLTSLGKPLYSIGSPRLPLKFLLACMLDIGIQKDQTINVIITIIIIICYYCCIIIVITCGDVIMAIYTKCRKRENNKLTSKNSQWQETRG